jgi:hypothetical protein
VRETGGEGGESRAHVMGVLLLAERMQCVYYYYWQIACKSE